MTQILSINKYISSIFISDDDYKLNELNDIEIYFMRHGQSCSNLMKDIIQKNKELRNMFLSEINKQNQEHQQSSPEISTSNSSVSNGNNSLDIFDFDDFENIISIKKNKQLYDKIMQKIANKHTLINNPNLSTLGFFQTQLFHTQDNKIYIDKNISNLFNDYNNNIGDKKKIIFCSSLVRAMETAFLSYPNRTFSYKLYKLNISESDIKELNENFIYILPFIKEVGFTPDNVLPNIEKTQSKFIQYLHKLKTHYDYVIPNEILIDSSNSNSTIDVTKLFTETENIKDIKFIYNIIGNFKNILLDFLKKIRNEYIKNNIYKFIFVSHNNFIKSIVGKDNIKTDDNKLTNTMIIDIYGKIIYNPPIHNKDGIKFINVKDNDKLCLYTTSKQNNEQQQIINNHSILEHTSVDNLSKNQNGNMNNFIVVSYNMNNLPFDNLNNFVMQIINEHKNKLFYIFGIQESGISNDKYIEFLETIKSTKALNYYYCNKESKLFKSNTKLFILYKENNLNFSNPKYYDITSKLFKNKFNKHIIKVDITINNNNNNTITIILVHLPKKKLKHFFETDYPKFKDTIKKDAILFGDLNARTLIFNKQKSEYKLYNDVKFNKGHNEALVTKLNELTTKNLTNIREAHDYKNSLNDYLENNNINNFSDKNITLDVPTYRYEKTAPYDISTIKKGKKFKVPSFPDRVLYRGDNLIFIESLVLDRFKGSDHLPILVEFNYLNNSHPASLLSNILSTSSRRSSRRLSTSSIRSIQPTSSERLSISQPRSTISLPRSTSTSSRRSQISPKISSTASQSSQSIQSQRALTSQPSSATSERLSIILKNQNNTHTVIKVTNAHNQQSRSASSEIPQISPERVSTQQTSSRRSTSQPSIVSQSSYSTQPRRSRRSSTSSQRGTINQELATPLSKRQPTPLTEQQSNKIKKLKLFNTLNSYSNFNNINNIKIEILDDYKIKINDIVYDIKELLSDKKFNLNTKLKEKILNTLKKTTVKEKKKYFEYAALLSGGSRKKKLSKKLFKKGKRCSKKL